MSDIKSNHVSEGSANSEISNDLPGPLNSEKENLSTVGDDEPPSLPSNTAPSPPPDGGLLAWSQVFAGFFCFFNSWGVITAFGVYQNYYTKELLTDESPSNISWIGSLQAFTGVVSSIFIGRLVDGGFLRYVLFTGTFLLVFGLMMTSLASELYQLILAQGICIGIGCSCFYASGIATVAPYFSTRRSAAIGITAIGSSIGGIVYPIMAQKLIPSLGFPWATRVIAFMNLGVSAIPCSLLRSRLPPRKAGPLIDVPSLKDRPFVMFSMAVILSYTGFWVPIFYLESYSRAQHARTNVSTYIISILNAGSAFGRLIPNFFADKTGPLNMLILSTLASAILTYGWIGIKSTESLIAFAILFGFSSGGQVSLPGAVVASMTKDMSKLGTRIGMSFGLGSIGVLVSGPIAGALINRMNGDYLGAQLFSASIVMLAAIGMIVAKFIKDKRLLARV